MLSNNVGTLAVETIADDVELAHVLAKILDSESQFELAARL
jgi:hypothetical protein